jgi:CYTH domain-containing protein
MAGLYYLTVKSHGKLIREEREIQLTSEQFTALWPLTEHRRIEKTRYFVQAEGPLIEVDVYKTALSGLIVAEVEYTSVEQSLGFVPPEWFGEEITDDDRYKNRSLAFNGFP